VTGRDDVRGNWQRQWAAIDPRVDPLAFTWGADGHVTVTVQQIVRDLSGNVLSEQAVQHVYQMQDRLVRRMEIGGQHRPTRSARGAAMTAGERHLPVTVIGLGPMGPTLAGASLEERAPHDPMGSLRGES
jgi:hypothetical protein